MSEYLSQIMNNSPVFFITAIVSTAIFTLLLVLSLLGLGDGDSDVGFDVDTDTDASFLVFSFKEVLAALMGFGLCGTAMVNEFGFSVKKAIIPAVIAGLFVRWIFRKMFKAMRKLEEINEFIIENAIGKTAKVYLPISVEKPGQVTIEIDGTTYTLDAISKKDSCETHSLVIVESVENNTTLVVKKS